MELRQLEYFLAVAREGSFTRAAQGLHVAQSAVSTQIARLERELGVKLLDRGPPAVQLTTSGRLLADKAEVALDTLAEARRHVGHESGLLRGRVVLGSNFRPPGFDLPRLLADFVRQHPLVEVMLREETSAQMTAAVRQGDLDVAIISYLPGAAPQGVWIREIVTEPILAVMEREHPLAAHETVVLDQIREWPTIEFRAGSALRHQADALWRSARLERSIGFEVWNVETMIDLAAHGLGTALLPRSITDASTTPGRRAVVAHPISEVDAQRVVAIAARREGHRTAIGQALLDALLERISS